MIILAATTDELTITLSAAVATNEPAFIASWRDITTSPPYTAGRSVGVTAGTTPTALVASPASATQRLIDFVNITNTDTAPVTLTLTYTTASTTPPIWTGTLGVGEAVSFTNGVGFVRRNTLGTNITAGVSGADGADGLLSINEVEIDFGSTLTKAKTFTITDAAISPTSKIIVTQSGVAATGRSSDENELSALVLIAVPGTGDMKVYTHSISGRVSGKFKINYVIS